MALQDCRLMTHTLVILNTLPKPPASAAAQNFQYLLGSFFLYPQNAKALFALDCQSNIIDVVIRLSTEDHYVGILLHSTTNSDRKRTDLSAHKKHNLQSIINIEHPPKKTQIYIYIFQDL